MKKRKAQIAGVMLGGIIAVIIGTFFGKYILSFIPESMFRILFKTALTIIAIKLIIEHWI